MKMKLSPYAKWKFHTWKCRTGKRIPEQLFASAILIAEKDSYVLRVVRGGETAS